MLLNNLNSHPSELFVMKNEKQYEAFAPHGLYLLLQKSFDSKDIEDCVYSKGIRHRGHPLGLDTPKDTNDVRVAHDSGTASTDAFVMHIREFFAYCEGSEVRKLRIITTPPSDGDPDHHYVFFEIWLDGKVLLSGETSTRYGAQCTVRKELEDIFDVLSRILDMKIERVSIKNTPDLHKFYQAPIPI